MQCPKCKSDSNKAGFVGNTQRHRCKKCGFQFTRNKPQWGFDLRTKYLALYLYLNKMSIRSIAKVIGASPPTVSSWVREQGEPFLNVTEKRCPQSLETEQACRIIEALKNSGKTSKSKPLILPQDSNIPVFIIVKM